MSHRSIMQNIHRSFLAFAHDIKLSHTIFALPFAASSFVIAGLTLSSLIQILWLLLAMVGARSFAMGFNRWADRNIDQLNDRTQNRQIPAGNLSASAGLIWTALSALVLIVSAFKLNDLSGILSLPLLAALGFYSYWKRFSYFTHWYLGFCLGLSPTAVGVALTGEFYPPLLWLGGAIMMWTAGFDIIYSLQDQEFDVKNNLKSIPSTFGPRKSIHISRLCFITMIAILTYVGILASRGPLYYIGVGTIGLILTYEHYLIRGILSGLPSPKLGVAFFNMNAYVSVLYFTATIADQVLRL